MRNARQQPLFGSRDRYQERRSQVRPVIAGTPQADDRPFPESLDRDWQTIQRGYGRYETGVVHERLRVYRQRRVQALRSSARRDNLGTPLTYIDAMITVLKDVIEGRDHASESPVAA